MIAPGFSEQGLHVMSKPVGAVCNLDCAYCYYLKKKDLYPGTKSWRMTEKTLDAYIRQYIEAQPPVLDEIIFGWQGGEPTLLGIDIAVFEEWLKCDVGRTFVQIFDEALTAWLGLVPPLCIFRKQCGRALAIEHNGDLYSCDHFVEPTYKLGNIHERPIAELANSERQERFGRDKEMKLPAYCRKCDVRFVCNGECPKNRLIRTPDGELGLNFLCKGYYRFFKHIDPVMKEMAEELRHGRPAMNVVRRRNATRRSPKKRRGWRSDNIGRNDPCLCGSGRKYKRCCMKH